MAVVGSGRRGTNGRNHGRVGLRAARVYKSLGGLGVPASRNPLIRMETPVYAVCEHCVFLRAFAGSVSALRQPTPERCPACGRDVTIHGREERYPSAYVGRISRQLHATPPLRT